MSEVVADDKLVEVFARMWIMCDPNRAGHEEGYRPDDIVTMYGPERQVPRWHWFVPRAEASIKFLKESGVNLGQPANPT